MVYLLNAGQLTIKILFDLLSCEISCDFWRKQLMEIFFAEKGIYRDNLSAIVIGDNLLPIIVIAQKNLDVSIIDIAFAIYFVIADKLSP